MHEVDKLTTVFPAMEDYFIAAQQNTLFITELITTIIKLLKDPQNF
jgi:hypothetical protein